jgi:hypothetical protein
MERLYGKGAAQRIRLEVCWETKDLRTHVTRWEWHEHPADIRIIDRSQSGGLVPINVGDIL